MIILLLAPVAPVGADEIFTKFSNSGSQKSSAFRIPVATPLFIALNVDSFFEL
jgi:hypothetical protein